MTSHKPSLRSTNRRMTKRKLKPKPKPSRKPRGSKHKKVPITIDRLSKLPDHILHRILSFLPLKQAGCTSILSHRWRHVWSSMQGLQFYMDEFEEYGQDNFISYVNASLPYRLKQDLQILKTFLFSASPTNRAISARWINHALKNDVQVLHIIIRPKNSDGKVILSRPMLTSQSIEELGLFNFPNVKIVTPNVISLTQLKKLSLQRVEINSLFVRKIISGCPKLEDLNLHYCTVICSEISSSVLRNLVMEHCGIQIQRENKFFICTPSLVHLRFSQGFAISSAHETIDEKYYRRFMVNVQNLKLNVPNLKSLTLGGYWIASYPDVVPYFLQQTPMLEKLTLICIEGPGFWRDVRSANMSTNLHFQCRNLNAVKIICQESDKRIPHLTEILKRNGISNLNLTRGGQGFQDECLKMLYKVWYWINANS